MWGRTTSIVTRALRRRLERLRRRRWPHATIRDFRVTFKLGQEITGDVPFDIGLKGVP